ncbi:MAG: inositol monophosphatase family protein [Maioricimonas sp. JB049]
MDFLETACEAARIGGRVLDEWSHKFTAREKSPADLVTEADVAAQKAIFEFIEARFPEHRFLGEEGLTHGEESCPYRWVIDPLDGTANYVHRFPYYGVSIGLELENELIVGAIYDPNRDELFAAAKGQGATLNGEPITVSERDDLEQALCMASLPLQTTREDVAVQRFLRVLEAARNVQRTGSAALNLCGVACGRIDGYWSQSLKPWDMAAGVIIVREAGGLVTQIENGTFVLEQPNLLASNGTDLHGQLVEVLG